jgi:peptidoglycan hydrolase-like protein with peptidoglycan-binding domain
MALSYVPFKASARVRAASQDSPPFQRPERGPGVALLQAGLIQVGLPMPGSMGPGGLPDGAFGNETERRVRDFQTRYPPLGVDGVAGRDTLAKLDSLLAAASTPAPPPTPKPPPRPPNPVSPDYQIGTSDPALGHDPGAGPWGSKPKTVATLAAKAAILTEVLPKVWPVWPDAARHLAHYFANWGSPLTIELEGLLRTVPSARPLFELEVAEAKAFVERLSPGHHSITSTRLAQGYNQQAENMNWFLAIGGYSVWGKGTARVFETAGARRYELDFEYKFYDRYNWDGGKKIELFGFTITDEFMGEFHREGVAREFDCFGSVSRQLSWDHGQAIPRPQLDAPRTR